MRFIKHISPASRFEEIEKMSEKEKFELQQGFVEGLFRRFGYSSKEAADMIVDGVLANKSKIMVGWDAVIMDWWVRAVSSNGRRGARSEEREMRGRVAR